MGGIHRHLDLELIGKIAAVFPQGTVLLLGPVQTDVSRLAAFSNIRFEGKKEFSELPHYIRECDVCMVPYALNDYTRTVLPTKINEYHAMGKPVVCTSLPEVRAFNPDQLIYIGATHDEFLAHLQSALKEDPSRERARIQSARNNSWPVIIDRMSVKINEALQRKKNGASDKWHEIFVEKYRRSRLKIVKAGLMAVLLWGVIFYTSMSETYIMKTLSMSLGVPFESIILEDQAKNTYENVSFSNQLLNQFGWQKIILVSSPYHMRRASLVFNRVASDKEIICSPVPDSTFYHHGGRDKNGGRIWKQIRPKQLRALLHEHIAIVYYWLKGYI